MILCPLCNKTFVNRRGFSGHLTRSHDKNFLTELDKERLIVYTIYGKSEVENILISYVNGEYCIYNLPIDIGKYIFLSGIKRSSKEERKTDRYKKVYLDTIQKKYGNDITNISQVQEIKDKKKLSLTNKYSSYEKYIEHRLGVMRSGREKFLKSEKRKLTQLKQQQTCLERYGHINFGCGKLAREKSKETRRKTISKWSYQERLERTKEARKVASQLYMFCSKPEKRIRKILIDLDIESKYNQFLWNYNWDLVFSNFIIEVQGTLWHADPRKYNSDDLILGEILVKDIWKKDEKKLKKAMSEGYIVIEIWEDDINKKTDEELLIFVKNELIKNGYEFNI